MDRYLLFAGKNYYPRGGWDDFKESFDDASDAASMGDSLLPLKYSWWHVVDTDTGQVAKRGRTTVRVMLES